MSRTTSRKKREYAPIDPSAGRTVTDAEFLRGDEGAEAERRIRAINAKRSPGLNLASMRAHKGLTQAQFAEKTGWNQSRVSRLESADMEGVSLADLSAYSLHCGPTLMILGKTTIAERINMLSEVLLGHCDALAGLADGDAAINDGVHELITKIREKIQKGTDAHLKAVKKKDKASEGPMLFPAVAQSVKTRAEMAC